MFEWIAATPLAQYIITHAGAQQLLETIHMTSFSLVIGAMVILDLRLIGVTPSIPVRGLARHTLWVAWTGLAILFVGGVTVSLPRMVSILERTSFRLKMALLLVAVANLAYLHRTIRRHALDWDAGAAIPRPVRIVAGYSILLWLSVVVVARFMYAVG